MKRLSKVIAAVFCCAVISLGACSSQVIENPVPVPYPIDVEVVTEHLGLKAGFKLSYDAGFADEKAKDETHIYESDLYYLNESRNSGADPGAMYVSAEDIENSYNRIKAAKTQYMSEADFVAQSGTLDDWLEEYSHRYYMVVTSAGSSLNQADKDAYGATYGIYRLYTSTDLNNWQVDGAVSGYSVVGNNEGWWIQSYCWAPEFKKDPVTGLFMMFFSCSTKEGNNNNVYCPSLIDEDRMTVGIAISETPKGPYRFITADTYYPYLARYNADGTIYSEVDAQGNEWAYYRNGIGHDGEKLTLLNSGVNEIPGAGIFLNASGEEVSNNTPPVNIAYRNQEIRFAPQYRDVTDDIDEIRAIWPTIDINPVINHKGEIYIYLSAGLSSVSSGNRLWVIRMKDMVTPMWETLTHLTSPSYSIVYNTDTSPIDGVEGTYTNNNEGGINEGPFIFERDGWYYFTYSPWGYPSRRYAVWMGISDNPYGPFIKLQEFSPVCGIEKDTDDYMAGTGHHCFIEAGDELFCLYHCFYNPTNNYDPDGNFLGRAIGVDKITFQTYDQKTYNYFKNKQIALDLDTYDSLKNGTASSVVRSRNGGIAGFESREKFESFIREAFDTANGQHYENRNDPDAVVPIMYCNGPTYALQPLPDVTLPNGYTNIAPSATVTILEGDTDSAKYLNDQMTAYQEWSAPWETSTDTGTLRFKLAWDKPMTIRNIMVYEPYDWYSAFRSVKSIVFKLAEKPVWYPSDLDYNGYCYIEDLKVDTDAWTRMLRMRHGHSAMATFNEITVTEIYVTIDKYDKIDYEMVQDTSDENSIRVSEVYVMGREA